MARRFAFLGRLCILGQILQGVRMATLLDSARQAVTPAMSQELGERFGLEQTQVEQGIAAAMALILTAFKNQAATDEGADELLNSLQNMNASPAPLDALAHGQGDAVLSEIFGVGVSKVANWFQDTTGINVAPFLPLAPILVKRALRDAVKTDKLDRAGLTARLNAEVDAYAKANPQLASEINVALDMGQNVAERAARIRAQFDDDEWNTLAKTPALAGYAVMMSALSGPFGLNKEIGALLDAMQEYGQAAEPDSLVGLVSLEFHNAEQITALGANRENALALTRDACLNTLRILNEKEAYDETVAYKQFVVDVATRVAQASNDGGILGIGGKPVSKEEQMTLDLIAAALAYQP
jgi:hypothetical protein